MSELKFKGVWIPKSILLNNELTDKEKIVLAIVFSFSEDGKSCFVGNRYLSKLLNVTPNRSSKIVSSLEDKGYVLVKMNYYEETRNIKNREIILTEKFLKGIVISNNTYGRLEQEPIVPKGKYIKNKYKKYYNIYNFQKQTFEDWDELYDN